MSQPDFDKLLQKYLAGKCSAQEERVVLEWYEKLIEESSLLLSSEQKNSIEHKIWSALSANIQDDRKVVPTGKVVPLKPRKFYRIAIAACFILLLGIGIYWMATAYSVGKAYAQFAIPGGYLQITNEERSAQDIRLSDGTIVTLESQGTLYYPRSFQDNTRDVYLVGNAFFQVAHNAEHHFIVHSKEGLLTEVLGTSFSITQNQASHQVEVAVVTGRVLVYQQQGKDERKKQEHSVVLTPNQKVLYQSGQQQLKASLVARPKPLPKSDISASSFMFNETPLSVVINKLQATYGITITTENKRINNCHFTGDISKQGLYEQLEIICQSIQCIYEVKETNVILKGNGCE